MGQLVQVPITDFIDYKEIDGVKQSARLVIHQDGKKVLDVTAIEVKFPDKIDPSEFRKP